MMPEDPPPIPWLNATESSPPERGLKIDSILLLLK